MRNLFKYNNKSKRLLFIAFLLLNPAFSQAESYSEYISSLNFMHVFLFTVLGVAVLTMLFLIMSLNKFLDVTNPEAAKQSLWAGLMSKFNDSVPVEQEADILTDHDYDGIQELDNNLPPWWKAMFYATIVFSGIYIYYYHFTDSGKLQEEEYEIEMAMAEAQKEAFMKTSGNAIDESNVEMADEEGIANGAQMFASYCAACHGQVGEGGVGPNLTDEYWLHGGGVKNVFKSIKYGIPEKGMIAWQTQLSPKDIQDISSYIISIEGTNPPNAKEPQGEKYEEAK